jgi:acetyl-CoA synthetase
VFDYHDGDIYWCTADVGWVTGHSYILYGPLANGATTLMFEGVPTYPSISRFWEVIDKHNVNIFYTAPTAIRSLMQAGEDPVKKASRKSLRLLGSVGEPINPEAWEWYHRVVGDGRCPIVDTWWQTETGGILITPLPGATRLKPGSATQPFFGVKPQVVDADGKVLEGPCEGNLVIADSWPGQMRTVYGDHERFVQTYFSTYPGKYFTGDGCRRDADGYYWITGRVDDVINVSGHRMGTAEVESALVAHPKVSEAAVVGYPARHQGPGHLRLCDPDGGRGATEDLRKELVAWVRKEIGPIASPDLIQFAPACPRPARARSCAASCARSPRTSSARWATPRPSPTPPWSTTSSPTAEQNPLIALMEGPIHGLQASTIEFFRIRGFRRWFAKEQASPGPSPSRCLSSTSDSFFLWHLPSRFWPQRSAAASRRLGLCSGLALSFQPSS